VSALEAAVAGFERLRLSQKPRVLFVSHAYGGGVRRHIDELAGAIASGAEVLLLTPRAGTALELRWLKPHESLAIWLDTKGEWERLVAVLAAIGIDRVHFHHVHGLPQAVLDLPKRLACPHDLTLHDHFPACPQYHMQDGDRRFCGGHPGCRRCLDQGPAQWPLSIDAWRALFAPVLETARKVIAPSQESARRIAGFFPRSSPVVWPHPQAAHGVPPRALRVVVPGAISQAKGLALLVACAQDAAARNLPIHFHVIGYIAHPVATWPEVPLTIGGEYREGELPALLAASGADAIFFPAQVPETFSFTLGDAIDTGLPIVATNLGAFTERLAGRPNARIVRWDAPPAEVNDALLGLRAAPAAITRAMGVSFEDYRGRYLEGLRRGAPPAAAVELAPSWLEEPVETDPPTTTLAWLFDDAFLCGRALSRDKLRVRLRRGGEGRRVDVVIPVYRGEAETRACIESVLASGGSVPHEVVVINDAGPEPALAQWLRGLATNGRISLIEHGANRGFVATANEGMGLHRDRDVVLLNSDTEVAPGWLDRLAAHAAREPDVGTVTPFTNNGTICSYPRAHVANSLPFRETTASLDAKFASSNPAIAVDLPTAVGFCMYVTRRCLESVGTFDEERYGSGYGEEVDFCMRAARAGFRHVLAGDVFVRHVGEVSFGNSGNDRRTKAQAMVDQLYPEFQPRLREFLARDPLAPLRRRVDRARPPVSRLVALFRR